MDHINWGIIGCGDVTEIKSGPAFNKVPNSSLVAVMRRDSAKAKDYAKRHNVPRWFSDANQLINDPGVNAIYIATPPLQHEAYTLAALNAGKAVYVEKPMALNYEAAQHMAKSTIEKKGKLVVAHYRREWPLFKKIKQLIEADAIGDIRFARLQFYKLAFTASELLEEKNAWRVNPAISGGGLFHDLAPHQIDLMYYFFGDAKQITGIAENQGKQYAADDYVAGNILFKNSIAFSGVWCFNAPYHSDYCEIIGSKGKISFGFFSGTNIGIEIGNEKKVICFDALEHVQQPMIDKTVQYFLGNAPNPCTGEEASEIMRWMEQFTQVK